VVLATLRQFPGPPQRDHFLQAAGAVAVERLIARWDPETGGDFADMVRRELRTETERVLFAQAQDPSDPARATLARGEILALYERLALALARRFADRGEPREDLEQVARLGLLHAASRFDLARGVQFATYATQTIVGELKKHFRDRSWRLHVPRSLQEVNLAARRCAESLTQEMGRSPTVDEIANAIGRSRELTLEALELGQCAYDIASLDEATDEDEPGQGAIGDRIAGGGAGGDFRELAEARVILDALPLRLKRIVEMRVLLGLSQTEIARELGISQMHVSRLYRRAVGTLQAMTREEGAAGRPDGTA
jgi:RNA polymerase sigma-B factor